MSAPRRIFFALVFGGVFLVSGLFFHNKDGDLTQERPALPGTRIVSLSPGVTQTLFALGRGEWIVGVSDYCTTPGIAAVPRVGSALTPQLEKIAALSPTLIVTSTVGGEQLAPLSKLAHSVTLPWLTLDEWKSSVVDLGELVSAQEPASEMRARIDAAFSVPSAPHPPRVLLALDYGETGGKEIWFIKRNSIHGAILEAAGAKNAVEKDVPGEPRLSPEQLLKLDPDAILVLLQDTTPEVKARNKAAFAHFSPLSAVKNGRVAVVSHPEALTIGPELLTLIPKMRTAVRQLFAEAP